MVPVMHSFPGRFDVRLTFIRSACAKRNTRIAGMVFDLLEKETN
jgi:hypothetical protein